jgi:hypothetical protein
MGTLLAEAKAMRLDMDISADRVVWEEVSGMVDGEGHGKSDGAISGIPLPPLEGTVRLKADNFTFAGFSSNPLQATALLSPDGIKGEIQRGDVCGIGTAGKVYFMDEELGIDMSLSVKNGQLESTSLCLTENKLAVSGSYSLQAHVTGRGPVEKVAQTLGANSNSMPKTGNLPVPNTDTLEATFDFLNRTDTSTWLFPIWTGNHFRSGRSTFGDT